jgi:SnoaL-like domain
MKGQLTMDSASDIESIIAEHHIAKLIYRVYSLYDEHQYEQMLSLYADDVRFGSSMRMVEGRDQVAALIAKRPQTVLTRHIITNLVVTLTGPESASATATLIGYRNEGAFPSQGPVPLDGAPAIADCRFSFRKVRSVWLISENLGEGIFASRKG